MMACNASGSGGGDRCWLKSYPAGVPERLNYPAIFAWGLLEQTAAAHPDRTACCYYRQRLSYKELSEASHRTAAALVRLGVKPGDRVGILLPNMPEYLSVLNGIWMAGGIAAAISPLMVPEETGSFMAAVDCKVVVALDVLAPLVVNAAYKPKHILFASISDRLPAWQKLGYAFARLRRLGFWPPADHPSHHSLEDQIAGESASFEPVNPPSVEEPAYILPTGGTTGSPKIVTLTHRNLVANAWQVYSWSGSHDERDGVERMLCVLPFFHSYGLTTCALSATGFGATLIMHHRFIPRVVLKLVEEHQPTIFPAVPAMLHSLNQLLRERPVKFKSLRCAISGGAPLPLAVAEEFTRHSGAMVVEGYGMSEASPVICTGPLDGTNRPGTIGLPLPDTDVRIVDAETGNREMPVGEIGELIVRGPQVMCGYWNNPEATSQVIRDGWLFTGDLGTRDADGFFRIVDRKKDLIIVSGFNVYPADVEPVLRRFPGINDVVVIGVPDSQTGEKVKAVVSINPGSRFDRVAFDAFSAEHLAKHKRPKQVVVIEGDLPRNFLGKVLRKELREPRFKAVPEPAASNR